jgi:hypothetical protein
MNLKRTFLKGLFKPASLISKQKATIIYHHHISSYADGQLVVADQKTRPKVIHFNFINSSVHLVFTEYIIFFDYTVILKYKQRYL